MPNSKLISIDEVASEMAAVYNNSLRKQELEREIQQFEEWQAEAIREQWAEDAWLRDAEYDEENQHQLYIDDMKGNK
jgi:hypothetical protein